MRWLHRSELCLASSNLHPLSLQTLLQYDDIWLLVDRQQRTNWPCWIEKVSRRCDEIDAKMLGRPKFSPVPGSLRSARPG